MRTFVAVEASMEVRGNAHRLMERLRRAEAKVKWVAPENVHLTLKFLGDIPDTEISHVCDAVARAVSEVSPFKIDCVGAGAFPESSRPRTVWIGVGEGAEFVKELYMAVDQSLHGLGLPAEGRRFKPHLTIGRVRGGGPATRMLGQRIGEHISFKAGQILVDEVVIFSSELGRHGPAYVPLSHIELRGP